MVGYNSLLAKNVLYNLLVKDHKSYHKNHNFDF
jgi:hypothetical protein